MIELRPHHLLCTQGYSGKGYSLEFVNNMDKIVYNLRNSNVDIALTFKADNICNCCPNLKLDNKCKSEDKILAMDSKVIKYFNLEEKVYNYNEINSNINSNMNLEIMNDICGNCEWYPISSCKKNILNLKG